MEDLLLYCHLEKLFEFLSGNQNYDFLTLSQFLKINKIPGFAACKLAKAHYEIVY